MQPEVNDFLQKTKFNLYREKLNAICNADYKIPFAIPYYKTEDVKEARDKVFKITECACCNKQLKINPKSYPYYFRRDTRLAWVCGMCAQKKRVTIDIPVEEQMGMAKEAFLKEIQQRKQGA